MSLDKKYNKLLRVLEHIDRDYGPAAFACSFSV